MDKIIKIVLGLFIVILVVFAGGLSYSLLVGKMYESSLKSTYSYYATISTDTTLSNVTLFIPVPADPSGNSPVIAQYSDKSITGIPAGWKTTLFDAGKATYVKITTPTITVPEGTGSRNPYVINISVSGPSTGLIDTLAPQKKGIVFRPVQELKEVSCPQDLNGVPVTPRCFEYLTSVYADYTTAPGASVVIRSSLTGTNNWKIFSPEYNEYQNSMYVLMFGENHGWTTTRAALATGIGYYNTPDVSS